MMYTSVSICGRIPISSQFGIWMLLSTSMLITVCGVWYFHTMVGLVTFIILDQAVGMNGLVLFSSRIIYIGTHISYGSSCSVSM